MLEKGVSQEWDEPCHQVFQEPKSKLSSPPVLNFLEFDEPFEVHTDASHFAIGEVLMDGPLLMRARRSLVVKEDDQLMKKKKFAVVHSLKTWQHYFWAA